MHISYPIDPNGAPQLSPISASDDDVEIGGARSHHIGDEVTDGDDPESKRRCSGLHLNLEITCVRQCDLL